MFLCVLTKIYGSTTIYYKAIFCANNHHISVPAPTVSLEYIVLRFKAGFNLQNNSPVLNESLPLSILNKYHCFICQNLHLEILLIFVQIIYTDGLTDDAC